jgi:hypothetical protein
MLETRSNRHVAGLTYGDVYFLPQLDGAAAGSLVLLLLRFATTTTAAAATTRAAAAAGTTQEIEVDDSAFTVSLTLLSTRELSSTARTRADLDLVGVRFRVTVRVGERVGVNFVVTVRVFVLERLLEREAVTDLVLVRVGVSLVETVRVTVVVLDLDGV